MNSKGTVQRDMEELQQQIEELRGHIGSGTESEDELRRNGTVTAVVLEALQPSTGPAEEGSRYPVGRPKKRALSPTGHDLADKPRCDWKDSIVEIDKKFPQCRQRVQTVLQAWRSDACHRLSGVDGSPCSARCYLSHLTGECPLPIDPGACLPYLARGILPQGSAGSAAVEQPGKGEASAGLALRLPSLEALLAKLRAMERMKWSVRRVERTRGAWERGARQHWLNHLRSTQQEPAATLARPRHVLLYPGRFSLAVSRVSGVGLGELMQWTDLMTALTLLGHFVDIVTEASDAVAAIVRSLGPRTDGPTTPNTATASTCEPTPEPVALPYSLIYVDHYGVDQLRGVDAAGVLAGTLAGGNVTGPAQATGGATLSKGRISSSASGGGGVTVASAMWCRVRVLDPFGTHAEFNVGERLSQSVADPRVDNPLGRLGLNLRQFLTMYPHTPDNSFLGFAIAANDVSKMTNINTNADERHGEKEREDVRASQGNLYDGGGGASRSGGGAAEEGEDDDKKGPISPSGPAGTSKDMIALVYGKDVREWVQGARSVPLVRQYLDMLVKVGFQLHTMLAKPASGPASSGGGVGAGPGRLSSSGGGAGAGSGGGSGSSGGGAEFDRLVQALVPPSAVNHASLADEELQGLLRRAAVLVGVGAPSEGPTPVEAVALGCIFLNPMVSDGTGGSSGPGQGGLGASMSGAVTKTGTTRRGMPSARALTSQHPYLERHVGTPHVWTFPFTPPGIAMVRRGLERLVETSWDPEERQFSGDVLQPMLRAEFSPAGYLERLSAYVEHQDFCGVKTRVDWPPLDTLVGVVGNAGVSCEDACHANGLVCEPEFFPVINKARFLSAVMQLELCKAEGTRGTAAGILQPCLAGGTCFMASQPLLFSCAGAAKGVQRVCPCRSYKKGQLALPG
eukprot:jgi/Mesvir1/12910/Mv05932-RA.1